jgi:hypothetical protein
MLGRNKARRPARMPGGVLSAVRIENSVKFCATAGRHPARSAGICQSDWVSIMALKISDSVIRALTYANCDGAGDSPQRGLGRGHVSRCRAGMSSISTMSTLGAWPVPSPRRDAEHDGTADALQQKPGTRAGISGRGPSPAMNCLRRIRQAVQDHEGTTGEPRPSGPPCQMISRSPRASAKKPFSCRYNSYYRSSPTLVGGVQYSVVQEL